MIQTTKTTNNETLQTANNKYSPYNKQQILPKQKTNKPTNQQNTPNNKKQTTNTLQTTDHETIAPNDAERIVGIMAKQFQPPQASDNKYKKVHFTKEESSDSLIETFSVNV